MRKKILISYVFIALLVIAYSLTKSDKISYKFTYIIHSKAKIPP